MTPPSFGEMYVIDTLVVALYRRPNIDVYQGITGQSGIHDPPVQPRGGHVPSWIDRSADQPSIG